MESKNNFSQHDLSRELHNLHDELEAYNEYFNNTQEISSQTPIELSFFQSNLNIQEKQIYDKKMEFFSDEHFFQNRSDVKNSEFKNNFRNEEAKTIESENIYSDHNSKEVNKKMLKRILQVFEPGSIGICVLMILSCTFNGAIFIWGKLFWVGGTPLTAALMIFFGLLLYYGISLLIQSCDACKRYTFSGLSEASFPNKWIHNPLKAILFINNWGNMAINIFSIQTLTMNLMNAESSYETTALIVLILLPLSLFRQMKTLRFLFLIALFFPCYLLVNSIYNLATSPTKEKIEYKPLNCFIIFRIYNSCMFSFACHNNIPDIFQELKDNSVKNMEKSLQISFVCLLIIYISIGVFTSIQVNMAKILQFEDHIAIFDTFVACLFILYVILTLPLRVKTSKEILLDVFFPRERRDSLSKHFFLTFFTLIFCILPSAFLYEKANTITNIATTMLNPIVIILFLLIFFYFMIIVYFTFPAIFFIKTSGNSKNGFIRKSILFLFIFFFTFSGIVNLYYAEIQKNDKSFER